MRKAMVLGAMTLAGALASPAFADEFTGYRLGVLFSQDKLNGTYSHSVVNPPSQSPTKEFSDQLGYELFGGWALNKYLAAEVGFRDGTNFNDSDLFPEFVDALDPDPTSKGSEYYVLRQNIKSVQASVVGTFWLSDKFAFFGRAGMKAWRGTVYYAYGDTNPTGTTPAFKVTDQKTDSGQAPLFGFGIQSQLDHALVRFEYQFADIGDVAFGSGFSSTDNKYSSLAFSIVWTL